MLEYLVLSGFLVLIRILGIAEIKKLNPKLENTYLALTYYVVLAFAKTLPYIAYEFNIFLDNPLANCGGIKWAAPGNSPDPAHAKRIRVVYAELGQKLFLYR
jgi:hypothetical protein